MNTASTSQRNAARNAPARERRARVKPSTNRTDEYRNAGGWPRRALQPRQQRQQQQQQQKIWMGKGHVGHAI